MKLQDFRISAFRFWESGGEEITQEWFERGVGGDELVIGGGVVAFGADGGEEIAEGGFVFVGDEIGFGDEGGAVFEIDEAVGAVELEVDFLGIHQVEDRDVVFAVAQVLEGVAKSGGIGEEIGEDDDECALADFFGDGMECGKQAGFAGGLEFSEGGKEAFEVGGAAAGWDFEVEFVGADREAGGVALVDEQIREGCGDAAGDLDFCLALTGEFH